MTSIFLLGALFIRLALALVTTTDHPTVALSTFMTSGVAPHSPVSSSSASTLISLTSTTGTPTATPSASAPETPPNLSQISSSISSLLALLQPASSVSSQLTAIPTSVLAGLEGPNIISVYDQLFTSIAPDWFVNLPYGAENWVLGLEDQAATILPQIISLQSLANHAAATDTTSAGPALVASSSGSSPSTPTSGAATPTATPTGLPKANAGDSNARSMTQGQKIGLGVGLGALTLLACGGAIFAALSMRKKRKATAAAGVTPVEAEQDPSHPGGRPASAQELHAECTPDVEKNSASSSGSSNGARRESNGLLLGGAGGGAVHEMPSPEMEPWVTSMVTGDAGTRRGGVGRASFGWYKDSPSERGGI